MRHLKKLRCRSIFFFTFFVLAQMAPQGRFRIEYAPQIKKSTVLSVYFSDYFRFTSSLCVLS